MEFHQFTSDVLNLITHYDENSIVVNNQTFKQNIVVYQNQIDLIVNIDDLEKKHFKKIVKLKPEILLIGVKSNFKLNVSQHKNFIHISYHILCDLVGCFKTKCRRITNIQLYDFMPFLFHPLCMRQHRATYVVTYVI